MKPATSQSIQRKYRIMPLTTFGVDLQTAESDAAADMIPFVTVTRSSAEASANSPSEKENHSF